VQFDVHDDLRAALGGKLGSKLIESLLRRGHSGRDRAMRRLAKFRFQPANHGNNPGSGAERAQQKLAAGSFGQRELGARVNRPQMIQILRVGWELQQLRWFGSDLDAEKAIKRKFCDAVFQMLGVAYFKKLFTRLEGYRSARSLKPVIVIKEWSR
jgi:hypothetical protein